MLLLQLVVEKHRRAHFNIMPTCSIDIQLLRRSALLKKAYVWAFTPSSSNNGWHLLNFTLHESELMKSLVFDLCQTVTISPIETHYIVYCNNVNGGKRISKQTQHKLVSFSLFFLLEHLRVDFFCSHQLNHNFKKCCCITL